MQTKSPVLSSLSATAQFSLILFSSFFLSPYCQENKDESRNGISTPERQHSQQKAVLVKDWRNLGWVAKRKTEASIHPPPPQNRKNFPYSAHHIANLSALLSVAATTNASKFWPLSCNRNMGSCNPKAGQVSKGRKQRSIVSLHHFCKLQYYYSGLNSLKQPEKQILPELLL